VSTILHVHVHYYFSTGKEGKSIIFTERKHVHSQKNTWPSWLMEWTRVKQMCHYSWGNQSLYNTYTDCELIFLEL